MTGIQPQFPESSSLERSGGGGGRALDSAGQDFFSGYLTTARTYVIVKEITAPEYLCNSVPSAICISSSVFECHRTMIKDGLEPVL